MPTSNSAEYKRAAARFYINVNRNVANTNRKHKLNFPALSARRGRGGSPTRGTTVVIKDAAGNAVAWFVQRPDAALPCGATIYCECEYPPEVLEKEPGES